MAKSTDSGGSTRPSGMTVLGVDEAGRGPAIGPLVVAGVLIDPSSEGRLTDLGVRDSKDISAARREALVPDICEIAIAHRIVAVPPAKLNDNLNTVELNAIVALVDELPPDALYLDAPVGPRAIPAFVETFQRRRRSTELSVTAENKADARYPVVAAASILAKVYRDEAIARLHAIYGDFGSGYPADPKTQRFLSEWYDEHRSFPACVRTRWGTVRNIVRDRASPRLVHTPPPKESSEASPRT